MAAASDSNIIDELKSNRFMTSTDFDEIPKREYNNILQEYERIVYSDKLGRANIIKVDNFNVLPIFWKEFIMAFCVAFDIIKKCYKDDSLVLSLGESPSKLVFTQSLFYNNPKIDGLMKTKGIPKNIEFQYLPLSYLRHILTERFDISRTDTDTVYEKMFISENTLDIYLQYFMTNVIDPKSIIKKKKNFIIIDRVESYRSILSFIFMYFKLAKMQKLAEKDIKILIKKFKIVGFDGNYDEENIIKAYILSTKNFITCVIFNEFGIYVPDVDEMFEFYKIPIKSDGSLSIIPCKELGFEIKNPNIKKFINGYFCTYYFNNYINFNAVPEYINRESRCIRTVKIGDMESKEELIGLTIKEEGASSNNCNIINLILYIIFNDLISNNIISKLLTNELNMSNISLIHNNYNMLTNVFRKLEEYGEHEEFDENDLFHIMTTDRLLNEYSIFYKMPLYDELIAEDSFDMPKTEKNLLLLDFDETLGSFNINFSLYSKMLFENASNIEKTKVDEIKKELLVFHIRPKLKEFFKELKKLKDEKKIHEIFIMSRNSDENNHPNYFTDTIKIIQEMTETPGLIDAIITNIKRKKMLDELYDKKYTKYFIIDDKCEHVDPINKCIPIKPYISCFHYNIFINILKKYNVGLEIISNMEEQLKILYETDFDMSDKTSIISQYHQIMNPGKIVPVPQELIKAFIETYQPTEEAPFKHNKDDNELMTVLEKVKEKYNVNPFAISTSEPIAGKLKSGFRLNQYPYHLKYLKYKNKYLKLKTNTKSHFSISFMNNKHII